MVKIGAKIDEVRIDGDLSRLRRDLEHFAGIGLDAVELPVHGLDAIKNGRLDAARVTKIRSIIGDFDFAYSVHAPNPLNLMNRDCLELHEKVFQSSLEFAVAVGAPILVYHAGRFIAEETFPVHSRKHFSEFEKQDLLSQERELLQKLAGQFPQVTICLENARPYLFHSPYGYAEQPELLRGQVEKIERPNVKINLDFGHLSLAAHHYGFDPVTAAEFLGPLVAHCHVHDNFGRPVHHYEKQQTHQLPFGRGDSHLPVGWGEIPIAAILAEFISNYQGMLLMELRSRYFQETAESQRNLKEILEVLKQEDKVKTRQAAANN
jgi:sugar phosphate isomerase/epimerase